MRVTRVVSLVSEGIAALVAVGGMCGPVLLVENITYVVRPVCCTRVQAICHLSALRPW